MSPHIDEEKTEGIIKEIELRGLFYDETSSFKFRKSVSNHYWLRNTIMVFRKREYIYTGDVFANGCNKQVFLMPLHHYKSVPIIKTAQGIPRL